MLKRLFGIQGEESPGLVFKGGTSLSKGYNAIHRFSEDIDLSFDRADLGYDGDRDPEAASSRKKAQKLIDDLVADVEKHIETVVLPRLSAAIECELGPAEDAGWSLEIESGHPQNLIFDILTLAWSCKRAEAADGPARSTGHPSALQGRE
ncbi:nucleotidyl transferase AbiEii/AbiGii toxin family protein [Nitrobacter sp. JJSN]|uniref:nucleotidyl transferase AbiEii/AbiGii toxin family protein n=1 Tax=Nitrobacter sp. JJSN TaxID=3453033 RepID=UPI003F7655CA